MPSPPTINPSKDVAESLALQALAWSLSEEGRAQRLLDLTGLDPQDLRARADEPTVLASVLSFLEAHEPDLLECADALEVRPEVLVAARERLER